MPRPTRDVELVKAVDEYARDLLKRGKEDNFEGLEQRVLAFKEVCRWISIKNRLDGDDEEEGLNALKEQLKPNHATGSSRTGNRSVHGPNWEPDAQRARIEKRWRDKREKEQAELEQGYNEGTGRGLANLRARISAGPDRDDDGSLPSARVAVGSEAIAAPEPPGSDGPGLDGDDGSDAEPAISVRDL